MTSIIEQADAIVGINPDATALDAKSREWLRRGAYCDWLQNYKGDEHPNGFDLPRDVSGLAEAIVRLHKPRGER